MEKKLLILMMEAGSGHKIPAQAIKTSIKKKNPEIDIRIVDPGVELKCEKFDKFYKNTWKLLLSHPKLFDCIYPIVSGNMGRIMERTITRKLSKRLLEYIKEYNPDFILTTHFSYAQIIGRLKKQRKIRMPTSVIITDAFNPHRGWVHENNNTTILYSKGSVKKLKSLGLKNSQIKNFNFPLREIFHHEKISNKIPKDIIPNKFTVTLLSGGEGIGKLDKFVKPFIKADPKIQMIVICGRNKKLHKKLTNLAKTSNTKNFNLVPLGFVSNMHEYIAASDLMMGKSGISFMFESLIFKKPIIFTQCLANEKPALKYFLSKKVCWHETNPNKCFSLIMKIFNNKNIYKNYVNNIEKLNIQNGTDDIAEFIINTVG